jgi:predicted extracellular nuclease
MRKSSLITALFLSLWVSGQSLQEVLDEERQGSAFRAVFYNLENLFDTLDAAGVQDEEFLPNAEKSWDSRKYRIKVANMAKAIRSIGGWQAPELVGVVEVENRKVLLDLIDHPALKSAYYEIVHYDSDDPRGIDAALLYNPELFKVIYAKPIKMRLENVRTRNILYVKLIAAKKDTLHVFVNHWPSRRGGKEQSEAKRVKAADILRGVIDSILENNPAANILAMGDFNDAPTDKSLIVLAGEGNNKALNNLMATLPKTQGSHKYSGNWDYLDQLLVSQALIANNAGLVLKHQKAFVFNVDFLVENDDRYGDFVPFRTWKGPVFIAGFSDHLPVFVDITYR